MCSLLPIVCSFRGENDYSSFKPHMFMVAKRISVRSPELYNYKFRTSKCSSGEPLDDKNICFKWQSGASFCLKFGWKSRHNTLRNKSHIWSSLITHSWTRAKLLPIRYTCATAACYNVCTTSCEWHEFHNNWTQSNYNCGMMIIINNK